VRRPPAPARLAALLVALACAGAAVPAASAATAKRDLVFAANSEEGTVTLLDARELRAIGTMNVVRDRPDARPAEDVNLAQDLDLSPDGRVLYVSRGGLNDVAAFSLKTGKLLWRVPVSGFRADHMTISKDGRRLFVSVLTANRVEVIDTRRRRVVGAFRTGDWPHGSELSHDGRRIFNGSLGTGLETGGARSNLLTIADTRSLEVERTIRFPSGIRPFVLAPDEKRIYAQLSLFSGLIEYSLTEGRVLSTLRLPLSEDARMLPRSQYPFAAAHHGMALSHDGRHLCVAGTISDYAALVALPALEMVARIPVGDEPGWVANSPNGRLCFVSNRGNGSNTVSAISYAKRREIRRIRVGNHPQHLLSGRVPEASLVRFLPRIRLAVSPRTAIARRRTTFSLRATTRERRERRERRGRSRGVRGAVVTLAGARARTDGRGRARLVVRFPRSGRYTARAASRGTLAGSATVRVLAR
jgi:6-phosphogluconolactonase (cycloisomerase 2 family)